MVHVEACWRCGAEMGWLHQTWQCPRCRFKLGCCEGEAQTCYQPGSEAASTTSPLSGAEILTAPPKLR